MEEIHSFHLLVNESIKNPSNKDIHETIYNEGIRLLLTIKNIDVKETILNQLIFLFPTKNELYYYMGFIFKDINIPKSLAWFQICFQMNKDNTENILDLIKILFDNHFFAYIHYLNKTNNYILDNHKDPRVQLQIASAYIQSNMLNTAQTLFLKILTDLEKINSPLLLNTYCNYTFLLSKTTNIEFAIHYYKKVFDYIKHNNLYEREKQLITVLYHNYVIFYDYIYYKKQDHFEILQFINNLYIQENSYPLNSLRIRKHRKTKIGYISSDFYKHAVSNFIIPILENHDTTKYEIILFSEKNTAYLKNNIGLNYPFINIQYLNTQDGANMIYKNYIDVLIDLNGYTCGNRLDIFSKNPAPIQITYLGYPNTLGLNFIKYRITDSIADSPDSDQYYSETLLKMKKCFLLFKNTIQTLPVTKKKEESIILGSLNKELKNTKPTLRVWKKIMEEIPSAKIMIKLDGIDNIDGRIKYYSKELNIPVKRIIPIQHCSNEEYVQMFSSIDILLDTFPYSGTTTTCNALYNSVPVITLYNKDIHSHNVSSSLLIHSGFSELVAYNELEYIKKTVELSKNVLQLQYYREHIHSKFIELMNPTLFMKDYETMLEELIVKVYE